MCNIWCSQTKRQPVMLLGTGLKTVCLFRVPVCYAFKTGKDILIWQWMSLNCECYYVIIFLIDMYLWSMSYYLAFVSLGAQNYDLPNLPCE